MAPAAALRAFRSLRARSKLLVQQQVDIDISLGAEQFAEERGVLDMYAYRAYVQPRCRACAHLERPCGGRVALRTLPASGRERT